MLDTDMCSYIIREKPKKVLTRFRKIQIDQLCISVVTFAELIYGVKRSSSVKINRPIIDEFVSHLEIVKWDEAAAEHYGDIRVELEAKGSNIGANDMMIAAHARSLDRPIVTNNTKHFKQVPKLKVENWAN